MFIVICVGLIKELEDSTGRNIYLGVHGGPLVGIQINNLYTVNSRYIDAGYNDLLNKTCTH